MTFGQLILALGSIGASVFALFKDVIPKMVDAKIEGDEFAQAQVAAHESQIFEMFRQVFEDMRAEREYDRIEREKDRLAISLLGETFVNLNLDLAKSSMSNDNRQAQNGDLLRLLSQNVAKLTDSVERVEHALVEMRNL